jgi:magnesium transporter
MWKLEHRHWPIIADAAQLPPPRLSNSLSAMLTAFARFADGKISRESTPQALSAALADPQARLWVDMENPTAEELAYLEKVFHFHPLAIEDATHRAQRPKLENYTQVADVCQHGYYYMVIHGPDLETFKEHLQTKELDSFFSDRYLVTVHEKRMKSIDECRERAAADGTMLERGIDWILYLILDHLVDTYLPILDNLEEELDGIEEEALTSPTPNLLVRIAAKKRELLNFRRNIGPQREVIAQLTRGEVPFIRENVRIYFRDVQDHLIRTVETVELYRDLIMGARDIYLSSVSNHLNQIMKTLTIISVIAMPIMVVTSFFGMNFERMPAIHSPTGFWITMTLTAIFEVLVIWLIKWKGWL